MKSKLLMLLVLTAVAAGLLGCLGGPSGPDPANKIKKIEIIDLDKVLRITFDTLDALDLEKITGADEKELEKMAAEKQPQGSVTVMPATEIDPASEKEFLRKLAAKLSRANLVSGPVGVTLLRDGSVQGFVDTNRNRARDGQGEKELFRLVLDAKRGRLIASDLKNGYNREYRYGYAPSSFFSGYFLGAMLDRQENAGFDTTRLAAMKMAPASYHRAAQMKANRAARAAGKAKR